MSNTSLIPEIAAMIQKDRESTEFRGDSLLSPPHSVRAVASTETDGLKQVAVRYGEVQAPLSEALRETLKASDAPSVEVLHALMTQGDYASRTTRAQVLRRTSFVKRMVHNAGRRQAQVMPDSYYDRRVIRPIIKKLQRAANRPG